MILFDASWFHLCVQKPPMRFLSTPTIQNRADALSIWLYLYVVAVHIKFPKRL